MHPLAGSWTANLEKSRRHANHQFQSATVTFDVNGDVVTITHAGVNMSGKHESGTTVLHADGQDHPASPQAPNLVMVTHWRGANTLETEARQDGRVLGHGRYEVSDDGLTLTATVAGVDAAGKEFEQEIVFDRT
jgi:hypothetical protein